MSPEIKKRKVVLASVLKPVDDTRMAEKLATTLSNTGDFDVTIVAYPSEKPMLAENVTVLPLSAFKRFSVKRLIMPWIIFTKINRLKPDIIIINTPELLLMGVLNKLFFRRKLVYDVLENYYRNIRHTPTYPKFIRILLAACTRFVQICLTPFVDVILLAEKGYVEELSFARNAVVLENKLPKSLADQYKSVNPSRYSLLFSGTLASTTGVFDAIALCKGLHAVNQQYTLTIIGYCALPAVLLDIKERIRDYPFITLFGGDQLVPHRDILNAIRSAGGGIIIYPNNPATENSIPTKLYEYIACNLPVMLAHTPPSVDLIHRCNAGIVLPNPVNYEVFHRHWMNTPFDFRFPEAVFWENEGDKLIKALKNPK